MSPLILTSHKKICSHGKFVLRPNIAAITCQVLSGFPVIAPPENRVAEETQWQATYSYIGTGEYCCIYIEGSQLWATLGISVL